MNVFITASRKITFKKKNGKRSGGIQTVHFDAFQTPTRVTYEIVGSADPKQAYIDWVLRECSRDEEFPVYADDDIFGEGKPVGTSIYNAGKEHVTKFLEWIEEVEEQGFSVKLEVI